MTAIVISLIALWAGIYTGALALAYWKAGNRRGAVGVAILALFVLIGPPVFQLMLSTF